MGYLWTHYYKSKMNLFKKASTPTLRETIRQLILQRISYHINRIKPSVMKKIDIGVETRLRMTNEDWTSKVNAIYIPNTKPGVIRIFLLNFTEAMLDMIEDNIIEMIRHEITHSYGELDEKKTAQKERGIDIFKK